MNIKQVSIKSNADVKGFLAEKGITDLSVYVPETGFEGLTSAVQDAMSSVIDSACEKIIAAGENPESPLPEAAALQLVAGLKQSVAAYDAQSVGHYTAGAKAVITNKLTEGGSDIVDPWSHFVKGKVAAPKAAGISFEL